MPQVALKRTTTGRHGFIVVWPLCHLSHYPTLGASLGSHAPHAPQAQWPAWSHAPRMANPFRRGRHPARANLGDELNPNRARHAAVMYTVEMTAERQPFQTGKHKKTGATN